jgi:pectin methylesterase-like acyl-CoA thioesterase
MGILKLLPLTVIAGPVLTLSIVQLADAGRYRATAGNSAGSVTSTAACYGVATTQAVTRFPVPGSAAVNRDTTLRITFGSGAPVVGSTGRIRLFRASDDALIETIDLAAAATLSQKSITDAANVTYRYLPKTLGGNTYKYLPVTIAGNTAIVTFSSPSLLAHGQTYYVKIDAGAILDAAGATLPAIDDPAAWRFTIKPGGPAAGATVLRVAADGSADFTTVQGAVEHVSPASSKRTTILVAPGDYFEYVVVKNRPLVTLRGDGADPSATRIACLVNNHVYNLPPASAHLGARGVICIDGSPDFVMDNLTVQNLTAKGGSQAEAVVTRPGSPRCIFNKLRLLSFQDTNLIADVFVKDCDVEGDVDFMWGGGTVFYQNCGLRAMNSGYYAQYRTSAASVYGGIYVNCRFTAKPGLAANTQVLNRINPVGYPHAQMVLIDCAVGPHVKANPWQLDGGATTAPTLRVWEYRSTDLAGNLLDVSGRPTFNTMATGVGGSAVLPNQQIDAATAAFLRVPSNIFGGWTPVVPPPPSTNDE